MKGPEEFDAEAAAKALYEGMKGLGTDENIVALTTASHTNEQRQEIKDKYKTMYGSVSSNFNQLLLVCML